MAELDRKATPRAATRHGDPARPQRRRAVAARSSAKASLRAAPLLSAATLLLLLAMLSPSEAFAGAGLDCLNCPTIDRSTCPALDRALAVPAITTAELGAWLEAAPADATTVRRAAAVLGMIGSAPARKALVAAATRFAGKADLEVDLRAAAARVGDSEAKGWLGRRAADASADGRERLVAIANLASLGDKSALAPARASLGSGDTRLMAAAADAIGQLGDAEIDAPILLDMLRRDQLPVPVRRAVLLALTGLKAPGAELLASQLVGHPQRAIGRAALSYLATRPTRWVHPVVAWALGVEGLRVEAARYAGASQDAALGQRALQVVTSTVVGLADHRALLDVVVKLRPERAARALLGHMAAQADDAKIATLQAIGGLGDRSAISALVELLPATRGDVANFTVAALETLSGEQRGADVAAWQAWLRGKPAAPANAP